MPQKKVLSLVLCLAVMLSVMVVGAGAAFSDQDKIENTEAVDACSTLNIIKGYEDGAFHPERNIKRAEVSKMICVALNSGKDPNVSTNAVPTFTDVRGTIYEWAEGYIESCVAQGIVDGVGGTRFSPAGNVTAAQLAKMLLVGLGYNAKTENFVGNTWETNVNYRASQKGLYNGLEKMDTSAPVTRDQAAQMVWNAMQAYEVVYKDGVVQDKVVGQTDDKITLLRDRYNALISVGTLTEIDKTDLHIAMSPADVLASDAEVKDFSKLDKDYSSLMGQKVKVIYNRDHSDQVLGVFATGDNDVYTVNANQTSKDDDKVKFGGKSYSIDFTDGGIKTYVDGQLSSVTTLAQLDANDLNPNVYTFVDSNGNDRLDTLIVKTYNVAQVTYVASDKIIANGKTYKTADENIAKDLKKDDWVVITENLYNDNKDIVKVDVQTAKLDALRNNINDSVYFDGKGTEAANWNEYKIGDTWYKGGDKVQDKNLSENDLKTVKAGQSVDYVAVNDIMFAIEKSTGENIGRVANVALVLKKDGTGMEDRVKLAFFDGTTKTVFVDDDNANTVKFEDNSGDATKELTPGYVYEFSGSGDTYRFYTLKQGVGNGHEQNKGYYGDLSYRGDKEVSVAGSNDNLSIDDLQKGTFDKMSIDDNAQVILFNANDEDFVQITGKQFKSFKNLAKFDGKGAAATKGLKIPSDAFAFSGDMNGLDRIGALALAVEDGFNFDEIASATWGNYGFILTDAYWIVENQIMAYDIWTKDGLMTVQENYNNLKDRKARTAIGFDNLTTADKVNTIDDVDLLDSSNITFSAITGVDKDKKIVKFANSTELDVSSATILYVNSNDKTGVSADQGSIKEAIKDTKGNYLANALYIQVGDDADLLIVDQETYLKSSEYKTLVGSVATNGGVIYGEDAVTGNEKTVNITNLPTLKVGTKVDATITITTQNIANGKAVTAKLVNASGSVINNGDLAVGNGTVSNGTATIKLTGTPADIGDIYVQVTVDSVTAKSAKMTVDAADQTPVEKIKEAIAEKFNGDEDATGTQGAPFTLTQELTETTDLDDEASFVVPFNYYQNGYSTKVETTNDVAKLTDDYGTANYTATLVASKLTIADKADSGTVKFANGKQMGLVFTITEDATGKAEKVYALITLDTTAADLAVANAAQEANNALVETLAGNQNGKGFTHGFDKVNDSNVYTIQGGKNLTSLANVTTPITEDWTNNVVVSLEKPDSAPEAGNTGHFLNTNYQPLTDGTDTYVKMVNKAIQLKQDAVTTSAENMWTAVKVTIAAKDIDKATVEAKNVVLYLCVNGTT